MTRSSVLIIVAIMYDAVLGPSGLFTLTGHISYTQASEYHRPPRCRLVVAPVGKHRHPPCCPLVVTPASEHCSAPLPTCRRTSNPSVIILAVSSKLSCSHCYRHC